MRGRIRLLPIYAALETLGFPCYSAMRATSAPLDAPAAPAARALPIKGLATLLTLSSHTLSRFLAVSVCAQAASRERGALSMGRATGRWMVELQATKRTPNPAQRLACCRGLRRSGTARRWQEPSRLASQRVQRLVLCPRMSHAEAHDGAEGLLAEGAGREVGVGECAAAAAAAPIAALGFGRSLERWPTDGCGARLTTQVGVLQA